MANGKLFLLRSRSKQARKKLIASYYRRMFARRGRHLRIPVLEELTEAVLIHAGCQRKPSAGLRKLGGSGAFARLLSFS